MFRTDQCFLLVLEAAAGGTEYIGLAAASVDEAVREALTEIGRDLHPYFVDHAGNKSTKREMDWVYKAAYICWYEIDQSLDLQALRAQRRVEVFEEEAAQAKKKRHELWLELNAEFGREGEQDEG
jgi:hypothetical protein